MATLASAANGTDPAQSPVDVDVLVVGAGVTGIYQLYLAREAGFSVLMLEAGTGVGGTWYWNRYPGSRYDSESYTYGYFFSRELFDDWTWPEVFTGQAENERYFNHVVDRFDLRRHIRFNARIVAEDWDEAAVSWIVRAEDGLDGPGPVRGERDGGAVGRRSTRRCPGARTSRASRTTPGCGPRSRWTSPASGWRWWAPAPAGCR